MKIPLHIVAEFTALAAMVLPWTGCAGGPAAAPSRALLTTGVTTGLGAYLGGEHGARQAALGAAAGFITGEAINALGDQAQRDAFQAGYEKGQSNAVKQQYWIARDNQRPREDDRYEERIVEIDIPASEHDGVRREASKRLIRVVLPKEVK